MSVKVLIHQDHLKEEKVNLMQVDLKMFLELKKSLG